MRLFFLKTITRIENFRSFFHEHLSRNHADGNQARKKLRQDLQDEQDALPLKWGSHIGEASFLSRSSILSILSILSNSSFLAAWLRLSEGVAELEPPSGRDILYHGWQDGHGWRAGVTTKSTKGTP